ncbi:MAG: hypothetical protein ABI540_04225 [Spartobacteria bacterium]
MVSLDIFRFLSGNRTAGEMSDTQTPSIQNKLVFTAGGQDFTVRDVVDSAQFRGELEPAWKELLRALAAEAKADAQELEFDEDAIDTAAEQFRYQHDLITAEETEKWLTDRGVSLSDFSSYFIRHHWADKFDEVEPEPADYLAASAELQALLLAEMILSGDLDRMAQRLSWRVADWCSAGNEAVDAALLAAEEERFFERSGLSREELPAWLAQLGREEEWFRESLAKEAIHRRGCHSVLSPKARAHEVAALRLPLTRFEVETIELDSLNAAREALLCVREDGMSMEEVAAEGRYPYRHPEVLLEEIPEELQQKFLSVHPGEILDPIARGDGFHLCRVVGKSEPDLEDPVVKERAEERILDRYFADLMTRHILWRTLFV